MTLLITLLVILLILAVWQVNLWQLAERQLDRARKILADAEHQDHGAESAALTAARAVHDDAVAAYEMLRHSPLGSISGMLLGKPAATASTAAPTPHEAEAHHGHEAVAM
ncbi:MAG: hypothetical protein GEEBNDBF_01191 [bacterium]|nr:hypothetical protein [bacterium]